MDLWQCVAPYVLTWPPQRTVLSQVDGFMQCEVVSSQISLDGVGVQPYDVSL